MPTPIEEIKEQLKLCSNDVIKNAKIITPSDIGQDFLLHVAVKKWDEFVPNISRRASSKEDNTVPRLHTAPTILGCVRGFGIIDYLIGSKIPNDSDKDKNDDDQYSFYRGGLYIHKVNFDVAIAPNKKLVFDAPDTDETWLITYNENTRTFPATVIGRIVLGQLTTVPRLGELPLTTFKLFIEINDNEGIKFDDTNTLTSGYYEIDIDFQTPSVVINNSSKAVFDKQHQDKAAMLKFKEPAACFKW